MTRDTTTKASRQVDAARLWLVLAKAYGSIAAYVERCIAAQGLCLSDFMVLEVLLHKGPLTISAIGEKVLLASASMTSAIDRLESLSLVRRTRSATDRRIRMIELTAAGHVLIVDLYAQHQKDLEFIVTEFSASERKGLHSALKRLGLAAAEAGTKRTSA